MTIAALHGRDEDRPVGLDGLELERVAAPGRRTLWLGWGGRGTDAQVDGNVLVVSEAHAGPSASAIAAAYLRDGLTCTASLKGSFSFILYDPDEELLFATSDLTSRAPLAYWFDREALLVSSRALRIVAHPRVRRELDEVYLANLLAGLGTAPVGTTALRDIKRLAAGVAIVGRKDLVPQLLSVDRLIRPSLGSQSKVNCIAAFWNELNVAVDRSSRDGRTCLSLSGGLDSAILASVVARGKGRTTPMSAFSIVGPERAAEEIRAIEEIESAYESSVSNERIDASDATALAVLDKFELSDDPAMTPLAYLPARLRLWEAASRAGFGTVLDGDGADELFGLLVGPADALKEGQWRAAWRHLWEHKARRGLLVRSFILPVAPGSIRKRWVNRRTRGAESLPTYLSARARTHPAIAHALQLSAEMEVGKHREPLLQHWLSNPNVVGACTTHRHLASSFGLRLASPFMNRRVVELVLGIPSQWLLTTEYKGFLRQAAVGRVPEGVRMRAKDVTLPTSLLRDMLGSQAVRTMLADGPLRERLGDWVRFERLQGMLDAIARGHDLHDPFLWHQAEALVSFAYWYGRARLEYGIT